VRTSSLDGSARSVWDLWDAIRRALTRFTPQECRNYLVAAGYDDDLTATTRAGTALARQGYLYLLARPQANVTGGRRGDEIGNLQPRLWQVEGRLCKIDITEAEAAGLGIGIPFHKIVTSRPLQLI